MDTAKATVKKFIGKSGQHDTTVHEHVAPAVQHENVTRTEHEHVMPVVNREVHQDHYHTTVQPIQDQESLREQHHHKAAAVEHRSFEHGNKDDVERRLAEERGKFDHQKHHTEGQHTTSTEAAVVGEQKHHHVHEMIQPVVQKETVEPHVVHHTVPVHETHHNEAHHHQGTTLPAMTMGEFSKLGGSLKGREEHVERYAGEPQMHGISGSHSGTHSGAHSGTHSGLDRGADSGLDRGTHSGLDRGVDSGLDRGTHSGLDRGTHSGLDRDTQSGLDRGTHSGTHSGVESGLNRGTTDGINSGTRNDMNNPTTHTGHHTSGNTTTSDGNFGEIRNDQKPSLMDKLNPRKDADGDGKPGFMK